MRYIKSKESFLKLSKKIASTRKVNEEVTNDITFGGSLIGRLINSSMRKVRIMKNASKVEKLGIEFEDALNRLLEQTFTEEDIFIKQKYYIYYLLMLIYEIVISENTVQYRLRCLLTSEEYETYSRSGGGNVNELVKSYRNNVKKIYEADSNDEDEGQNIEDFLGGEDGNFDGIEGLIERTIQELEDSKLEDKKELADKLENFRKELLKIEYTPETETEEKSQDATEEDEKKEDEESKSKFPFTDQVKKLISSYLSIIRNIPTEPEKKEPVRKVGDIVAWKQVTGEEAGLVQFSQVTKIFDDDRIQLVKLKNGKPANTARFVLPNKDLRTLSSFEEDKYSKMPEKTLDEIKLKAAQARLAFYTFLNLEKDDKKNKYQQEVKRLNELVEKMKNKTNDHFISRDYKLYDRIFEAEVVAPKIDYSSIDTWSEIVEALSAVKKSNLDAFKSHDAFLSNLLEGKVNEQENPEEVRKVLRSLGKSFLQNIKSKNAKLLEKEISETDKKITSTANLMSQVSLALLKLRGKDISKLKGEDNKSIGDSVEKYLDAYEQILNLVKKGIVNLNEASIITSYNQFRYIYEEAEEQTNSSSQNNPEEPQEQRTTNDQAQRPETSVEDPVKKAWFKFFKAGEEKKWKFDRSEIDNYKTKIEQGPINVEIGKFIQSQNESLLLLEKKDPDSPDTDPILSIIDIFGRAYKLYATDYIPSGRPGGRVSQKTLREYEYIGSGKEERGVDASREGDYYTPGRGPWANVEVFEKWKDRVNKVISNKKYRAVLANVNFVSDAEKVKTSAGSDTRQEKGKFEDDTRGANSKGSGIGLMEFINKMLTLQGTYKDAVNAFTRKYFNIEWIKDNNDNYNTRPPAPSGTSVTEDDKKPFFTTNIRSNFKAKKGAFYLLKIKYTLNNNNNEKWWIVWVSQESGGTNNLVMRVQESDQQPRESIITPFFQGQNAMSKVRAGAPPNLPGVSLEADKDVFIIAMRNSTDFKIGRASANSIMKKVALRNGSWDTQNSTDITLVSIEKKFILCDNVSNNARVLDTPIIKNWNQSNKANKDAEITQTNIGALNGLRF